MKTKPSWFSPAIYNTFRFGKYAAVLGWVSGYYMVAQWYIKELKNTDIYEYKTARARLFKDMSIAKRMWQYGQQRAEALQQEVEDRRSREEDNALLK